MAAQPPVFDWYQIVEGEEFEQGDLIDDLPILIHPDTVPTRITETQNKDFKLTIEAKSILIFNVIVMTQSCDFNKLNDTDLVTLCPRYNYSDLYDKGRWIPLVEGRVVNSHLLNKCELGKFVFEYQVVDLTNIFCVPLSFLKRASHERGKRVRLLPPYREQLGQAFAKRFMRVGLPIDLPREYPYE